MTSIDEQREMRRTVADLLDRESDARTVREAMAGEPGFDSRLWQRITGELGLSALLVPERAGGLGLDLADAAVVLEEFGRRLVPGPLPETVVATAVLAACGTEPADALLAEIAEGGLAVTAAIAEPGTGWDIAQPTCRATGTARTDTADADPTATEPTATGPAATETLTGCKEFVCFGAAADLLLVVAAAGTGVDPDGASPDGVGTDSDEAAGDNADGPVVFAVRATAPGVDRTSRMTLDQTRRLADVEFRDAPATRVSAAGDGARIARLLVHLSQVELAVESAAAAAAALDKTVEYLKVRQQFGRPLGSFQALKHRCADLAVVVHGATATAAHAVDVAAAATVGTTGAAGTAGAADSTTGAGVDELAIIAPLAKSVCADALREVAGEMIQLHGGIGFTFEHDAHLYFKRGKANQQLFGSGELLRGRIAELIGLT